MESTRDRGGMGRLTRWSVACVVGFAALAGRPVAMADEPNGARGDLPINLYDTFAFERGTAGRVRTSMYVAAPLFLAAYGFGTWGWNARESFTLQPETFWGADAVNGGSDKLGHLYSSYTLKRAGSFLFRATGSSPGRANLEGALFAELLTLGVELGDGFSPDYGFDPYDLLFNHVGIALGVALDLWPTLDRLFAVQWEYVPTREMRERFDLLRHHDIAVDYSGHKYILATKLAGIPRVSSTPLRYINIDVGYYSRGYNPARYYASRTRHVYMGLSVSFSVAVGDALPVGYASSTAQSILGYVHLPWDWEAHDHQLSKRPHEEIE